MGDLNAIVVRSIVVVVVAYRTCGGPRRDDKLGNAANSFLVDHHQHSPSTQFTSLLRLTGTHLQVRTNIKAFIRYQRI